MFYIHEWYVSLSNKRPVGVLCQVFCKNNVILKHWRNTEIHMLMGCHALAKTGE